MQQLVLPATPSLCSFPSRPELGAPGVQRCLEDPHPDGALERSAAMHQVRGAQNNSALPAYGKCS